MKKNRWVSPIFLTTNFFFCGVSSLFAVQPMTVQQLDGTAVFRHSPQTEWIRLSVGQILLPSDEIQTKVNSRITLAFQDGALVRMAPESHIKINEDTQPALQEFNLKLVLGRAWASVKKNISVKTKLILETAQARIRITGTAYSVAATDKATDLLVFHGNVDVSSTQPTGPNSEAHSEILGPQEILPPPEVSLEQWHVIVGAFQKVSVENHAVLPTPQSFSLNAVRDEWIDWNLKQEPLQRQ